MKIFYVKLNMILGEIEKDSIMIVEAEDEKSAKIQALINECHYGCSYEDGQEPDQECWDGGQYVYQIEHIKEITKEQKEMLFQITNDIYFL